MNWNDEIQTHIIDITHVSGGHVVRIGYAGEVIVAVVLFIFVFGRLKKTFTRRGA